MVIRDFSQIQLEIDRIKEFSCRDSLKNILSYLYDDDYIDIFGISGLRRTGKTTLMYQAMNYLEEKERKRAACAFYLFLRGFRLTAR